MNVIRCFGTKRWAKAIKTFAQKKRTLAEIYRSKRAKRQVPVCLPDGRVVKLSPGVHNKGQAAVVEQFTPHFAAGAVLLYLGDTAKKNLIVEQEALANLGVVIDEHHKLPDVVLYDDTRKWIFLVEAVTSHGPMSPKRVFELQELFSDCDAGLVFVSAFPNFAEFRKHIRDIAWETEVWIMEIPDHLIHYNGDRFLGPR